MFARKGLSLVFALVAAYASTLAGCAEETNDTSAEPPKEDDVVSARQLNGSDMPDKTLSLTLDDGPGERTAELAVFLREQGVKGTFFINGKNAGPRGLVAIDAIIANGHILANHTQNHKQLTTLSSAAVKDEVEKTDAVIARAQPNGPWILRAPFGAWSPRIAEGLNAGPSRKYVGSVFWDEGGELTDHSAADWACWGHANVSVQRCGELYLKEIRAKRHGIVLMHDIHGKTVDMIKQIVPVLKSEGYKFVGVDEAPSVKRALGAAQGVGQGSIAQSEGQGEGEDNGAPTCNISASDGFSHLRQAGIDSGVLAAINTNVKVNIVGPDSGRTRIELAGWVSSSLTSCGSNATCDARVTIQDPQPDTLGQSSGTTMRADAGVASAPIAIVANGTSVEVISRRDGRLFVKIQGTVATGTCN